MFSRRPCWFRPLLFVAIFSVCFFFFFNDTATTEIYTLSLHDALPIFVARATAGDRRPRPTHGPQRHRHRAGTVRLRLRAQDRKSTRLNSSHSQISYAVFCLKKKKHHAQTA